MAQVLDQITVGEKLVLIVDAAPGAAAGTPAEIGSWASFQDGSVGKMYLKVGAADTAWDQIITEQSQVSIKQGNYRRLAIYDTDSSGFSVDDQIQQNGQDIDVIIAAQASRTSGITYTVPNPGNAITAADFVLTEGAQTINGDKTFNDNVTIEGNLDVNGTLTSIDTVNTTIQDKLITLNKGGAAASGGGSGIEFEEDGVITAYFKMSADRNGYDMKPSNKAGTSKFIGTAADQEYDLPDEDGRLVLQAAGVAAGVINQIPSWSSDEKLRNPSGVGADSLAWDFSNQRLGLGVSAPTQKFHMAEGVALFGANTSIRHQKDSDFRQEQDAIQTTDAAFQTLKTISIPNDSVVYIKSYVTGRKTGGTGAGSVGDGGVYERTAAFRNVGGVVTRIRRQSDFTGEDILGWQARHEESGTNVLLQVRGSANNNVDWEATTIIQILD
jgi:hypothetical protein